MAESESPAEAAIREAIEETGADCAGLTIVDVVADNHGGWSYATVIATAEAPFPVRTASAETSAVRWVPVADVAALTLHPGFAATWPNLLTRIDVPHS
jgi:8-oxo-dGTP pyrophosphatase MutT (NUDIX family)